MFDITIKGLRIVRDEYDSSTKIYVDDELAFDYKTNMILMPLEHIVEHVFYRYFTFSDEVECTDNRRLRVLECLRSNFANTFLLSDFEFKNMPYSEYLTGGVTIRINYHTKKGANIIKREYTTLTEPYPGAKVKKTFISSHPVHVRPPKDELFKVLEL